MWRILKSAESSTSSSAKMLSRALHCDCRVWWNVANTTLPDICSRKETTSFRCPKDAQARSFQQVCRTATECMGPSYFTLESSLPVENFENLSQLAFFQYHIPVDGRLNKAVSMEFSFRTMSWQLYVVRRGSSAREYPARVRGGPHHGAQRLRRSRCEKAVLHCLICALDLTLGQIMMSSQHYVVRKWPSTRD